MLETLFFIYLFMGAIYLALCLIRIDCDPDLSAAELNALQSWPVWMRPIIQFACYLAVIATWPMLLWGRERGATE